MTVNKLGNIAQSEHQISTYQELFELPEQYVEIVAELKARAKEVRLEYIQKRQPE